MSFLSNPGNSPPVKDPGLRIRSLRKLKDQFGREMEVLDQLEASLSLSDSAQAAEPHGVQAGGDVRRELFQDGAINEDDILRYMVIAEKL